MSSLIFTATLISTGIRLFAADDPPPHETVDLGGLRIHYYPYDEGLPHGADARTPGVSPITLNKFAAFRRCMKGPSVRRGQRIDCYPATAANAWVYWVCRELAEWCYGWDYDTDGDVDLHDFAGFQQSLTGENLQP
jgi:hypothetical protein